MFTSMLNYYYYDSLRSSHWFIPSLCAVVLLIVAVTLLVFDTYNQQIRLVDIS